MAKKVPRMRVQLAMAGMQLTNELKRQFQDGTVKIYGHLKIGQTLLIPGSLHVLPYNDAVKDAISRGILVGRGFVE